MIKIIGHHGRADAASGRRSAEGENPSCGAGRDEVEVGRKPKQEVGYADLTFAADGAFKCARRRLQAWFRFRDETKRHELGQPLGDKRLRRAELRFSVVCA